MAPNSKEITGLEDLKSTVLTTTALITQLQAGVPAKDSQRTEISALDLAHDSASLIRAHSTKLSLLAINKPFTASAVATILRELVQGPLPGLASAVELCDAARYTKAMSTELQYRAKHVFSGLETLIKAIPVNGRALDKGKLLPITGTVWKACDDVVELKNLGIAGLIIKKAEEYKALLSDALEELRGWDDEKDEEDDVSDRPRLHESFKRLRLLIHLYTAVVKRRFKTLPPLPHAGLLEEAKKEDGDLGVGIVSCLDELMEALRQIPDETDELAGAFYDSNLEEADRRMDTISATGSKASELLIKNWKGEEDEFTVWALKFQAALKES